MFETIVMRTKLNALNDTIKADNFLCMSEIIMLRD